MADEDAPTSDESALTVTTRRPSIQALLEAFFQNRSEHTIRAYQFDLADFHGFLQRAFTARMPQLKALRMFLNQGAGPANFLLLNYRSDLKARGKSPATVNRHLAAIRSFVKLARMVGVVPWTLEVESVKVEPFRDTRGPGVDVFAQMLDATRARTDRIGVRDRALLRLMYDLALRVGEIVRLDVSDLNLEQHRLWVLGKSRTQKELLSLPDTTITTLHEWLMIRGPQAGPLFLTFSPRRARDQRLTTRGVYRIIRNLGESVGVKVWPHALRHTSITEAVKAAPKAGITLDEVRQFSRHKNVNTLLVYRDHERNVQGQLAALVAEAPRRARRRPAGFTPAGKNERAPRKRR